MSSDATADGLSDLVGESFRFAAGIVIPECLGKCELTSHTRKPACVAETAFFV